MSYEILLTDTARADLEQRTDVSIRMLLDRIAQSAESDHILSAPSSAFELRYQFFETTYVFFRRSDESRQVTIIYFCDMQVPQAAMPPTVPTFRLVNLETRDIPHGVEVDSAIEVTRPDGTAYLHRQFYRKVDLGDSYIVFHHQVVGAQTPVTMIITGKKGLIDGDFRHDELDTVVLGVDGSIRRFPPANTPVWIKHPFENQPFEEKIEWFKKYFNSDEGKQRMTSAHERLSEILPQGDSSN